MVVQTSAEERRGRLVADTPSLSAIGKASQKEPGVRSSLAWDDLDAGSCSRRAVRAKLPKRHVAAPDAAAAQRADVVARRTIIRRGAGPALVVTGETGRAQPGAVNQIEAPRAAL